MERTGTSRSCPRRVWRNGPFIRDPEPLRAHLRTPSYGRPLDDNEQRKEVGQKAADAKVARLDEMIGSPEAAAVRTWCEHKSGHARPRAGHVLLSDSLGLRGFRALSGPPVPARSHGKEGVDGSSPSEGLKYPQIS